MKRPPWSIVAGVALTLACVALTVLAISGVVLSRVVTITGKRGGTLRVLSVHPLGDLDPARVDHAFGVSLLHATLRTPYTFRPDRNGLVPDLADGPAEISDDSRTLEIALEEGVRFSPPVDREVTAADVAYGIERGFLPGVDSSFADLYFKDIEGVDDFVAGRADTISGLRTPDAHTLEIRLTNSTARVLAHALTLPIAAPVPREYAAPFDARRRSTYAQHQVATGPYRFRLPPRSGPLSRETRALELERNPSWSDDLDFRPAFLDRIVIEPAPDAERASRSVLDGRDVVSGDFAAAAHIVRSEHRSGSKQIELPTSGSLRFVSMNTREPPFDDVDVRRAVTAAFDQAGARDALGGAVVGKIPTHWIPPGVPGFEAAGGEAGPGVDFLSYPQGNPKLARRYMRRAGNRSGRYDGPGRALLVGEVDPFQQRLGAILGGVLDSLGIPYKLRLIEEQRAVELCSRRRTTPTMCLNGSWVKDFDDAQSVLPPLFGGDAIRRRDNYNWSLFSTRKVDAAIERATVTTGPSDRAKAWAEVDRLITPRAPAVPIVWDLYPILRARDVKGIVDRELGLWDLNYSSLE